MPLGFSIIYNTVVTKDTPNMKSKIEKIQNNNNNHQKTPLHFHIELDSKNRSKATMYKRDMKLKVHSYQKWRLLYIAAYLLYIQDK